MLSHGGMASYGGNYVGFYYAMNNMLINENSIFKHKELSLYALYYKSKFVFSQSLDLEKSGWNLEQDFKRTSIFFAWNGTSFVPDSGFYVQFLEELPENLPATEEFPCKLQMKSDGPLGTLFPDQMGVYKLIEDYLVYNKPIWKHISRNFYLRVDEYGEWIVSSVSCI